MTPPGTSPSSGFQLGSCVLMDFEVRNREEERAKNMAILMGMSLAPSLKKRLPGHSGINKDAELLKHKGRLVGFHWKDDSRCL